MLKFQYLLKINIKYLVFVSVYAYICKRKLNEILIKQKLEIMKASSFLSGTKVYEFYFKNSNKIHFAIAKSKKTLSSYFMNDIEKIHLREDFQIDESCGYMDVILDENTPAKNLELYLMDFDVLFNDSENSNNKGFELSLDEAKAYIEQYNGTNESYFKDYKGGIVSIVNIETGETVYEEEIK